MREFIEFQIFNTETFQYKLNRWGSKFENFVLLNSNRSKIANQLYQNYDLIAAASTISELKFTNNNFYESLRDFINDNKDWIFGYLTYDLKNETEQLSSNNLDGIEFQNMFFFVPKYIFILNENKLRIEYLPDHSNLEEIEEIHRQINQIEISDFEPTKISPHINKRYTEQEYKETIEKIKTHILKGDIYELNLCQEFYLENIEIDPEKLYEKLNKFSPSPFSCFLRHNKNYLISSSPERFLLKRGQKIVSQPIKGTIRRSEDRLEDQKLQTFLNQNEKERAENIMITDLVRNDLSKTAKPGSVKVEELCKIYSYKYVHQMISTISSELDESKYDIVDLIKSCFPMGSMTGAPKIKAMELIEEFERTKRGLYSGSVGYISPERDFDFNVIIRSIIYNRNKKYLSFSVGSAITYQSEAIEEYKECLLKAEAIIKVLSK